ncbi:MAG: bifunctional non-ous end joining protein LigD [Variibacter sp.]|nr:bifunctional non-ous end joining protein LigD [Variibacter sp.]
MRERVILSTRNGYDWTDRFSPIASSIAKLPVNQAIFDGEIVSADKNDVPDFAALQEDLARGRRDQLVYYIFHLLYPEGFDLRAAPLVDRREDAETPAAYQRVGNKVEGPTQNGDNSGSRSKAITSHHRSSRQTDAAEQRRLRRWHPSTMDAQNDAETGNIAFGFAVRPAPIERA